MGFPDDNVCRFIIGKNGPQVTICTTMCSKSSLVVFIVIRRTKMFKQFVLYSVNNTLQASFSVTKVLNVWTIFIEV